VLQEVAAAQHVVLMCGLAETDGYTFCSGLKSLEFYHPVTSSTKIIQNVRPLISLIEQPGRRSHGTANYPEEFSLNIRSLAELLDMFHARHATDI
jgi:hypothetical protein